MRLALLDERQQIEKAVRAYFEEEVAEQFAAGKLAESLELTRNLEDPTELIEHELVVRRLETEWAEGDEARVAFDATDRWVHAHPEAGRITAKFVLHGPVAMRRIEGVWRVADYTRNGRLRSASLRLRPSGSQEIDGLRISAVTVDLQGDSTMLTLRVENRRHATAELDWGVLGILRRESWRFLDFGLGSATFLPATTTLVYGWTWKVLPLDLPALRLILVEKGERVGFDFVIDLDPVVEGEPAQPAPDALPLRLRLRRSPLALVPPLLALVLVFWLGSWQAVGFTLGGLGALLLGSVAWHRLKRRPVPIRRPASIGSGLLVLGTSLVLLTGSPFAGCPSRAEARPVADEFAFALLTGGPREAARYLAAYAEPIRETLPDLRPLPNRRAREIVRGGTAGGGRCDLFLGLPGMPQDPSDDPCFLYEPPNLPGGQMAVSMSCDEGEWRVSGFG